MPPRALFETHLNVRNLDRSIAFYRDVVGLEFAHRVEDPRVAFFWIGGRGHSMLGLWSGAPSPNVMQLHIAFGADVDAVVQSPEMLRAAGVEPLDFFSQPTDEPSAIGWMPAAAVYFKDPDGHLLEYLAMLPHAPRPEAGIVTYSAWLQTWARPVQT